MRGGIGSPGPKPAVAKVFDGYPPNVRRKLLALRSLIFQTAARTEGVGELLETLKLGGACLPDR